MDAREKKKEKRNSGVVFSRFVFLLLPEGPTIPHFKRVHYRVTPRMREVETGSPSICLQIALSIYFGQNRAHCFLSPRWLGRRLVPLVIAEWPAGGPASGPRCFPVGVSGHVVAPRGPGLPPAWEGRPLFLFPASDGGAPAFVGLSLGNFLRRWEEGGKTSSFTMGIRRLRASASLYGMPLGSLTLPFGGAAKALRLTACLSASLLCVGRYIPYFEGW